jgi:hypothetical protein
MGKKDIFVFSKASGAAALYAVLSLKGYFPESKVAYYLKKFPLASRKVPGVLIDSGSLNNPEIERKQQSTYYHAEYKGCETESKYFYNSQKNFNKKLHKINGRYCKTHQRDTCRCGWEWGHHYEVKKEQEKDPNLPE